MNKMDLNIIKKPINLLASKAFLLWLISGWLLYYVSSAIWIKEAFAFFVEGVKNNFLIQIPFVLFLISGYLNVLRTFRFKFNGTKIGFIAWLMLSIGVMLYFTGFFLSINMRQYDRRLVGEDDMLKLPWSSESYRITRLEPGMKELFRVSDKTGMLDYEPKITLTDSSSNSSQVGAYPPVRIKGTYLHILNFGLAPGVRFYKDGSLVAQGYMALRLLPPGRSDYFDIKPYPYRFLVSLSPEHTDNVGLYPEPVFNLKDPVYKTRVFSGEKIIADGDSKEGISFKNFKLSYFEPTYWILLESSKDPGLPLMKYGIFIFVFGIPVYVLRLALSLLSYRV